MRMLELAIGMQYRRLRYRCGVVVYLAVLLLGSVPGARAEIGMVAPGLLLHTAAYSLITFLLFTGTRSSSLPAARNTFLIVASMAALDELVQAMLPYRTGAVSDWLIDVNAAFVALIIMQSNWFKRQAHDAGQPS